MTIASEILKAQNNLKDCYDACKAVDGVVLPDDKNFDNLPALIEQALNPFNKPSDWSDIRTDCPDNSIALYAAHTADYSAYDNLGFTATCTGGYNVFIDGVQYGSTYASGAQCSITWSEYTATVGEAIRTPEALTAHKIWVEPATTGNNITAFRCNRVAASGIEAQGLLWAHFNLTNAIKITVAFGSESSIRNTLLKAFTAKNNLIIYQVASSLTSSGFYSSFAFCSSLEYLPVLKAENTNYQSGQYMSFYQVPAKKIVIKNNNGNESFSMLNNAKIEELSVENGITLGSGTGSSNSASGLTNLKKFPKINSNKHETFLMNNCPALEPVNIDDRFNDIRKLFRFYGTSTTPTPALKSLRVSNEAPFDGATPQINVNYTDLDRDALVQLFEDLPYNPAVGYTIVNNPTISSSGVMSNISDNDYATINNTPFSATNKVEMIIKFTPTELSMQQLLGFGNNTLSIFLKPYAGTNLVYGIYGQATSAPNGKITTLNVPYYLHFIFNVPTHNLKMGISTDGLNPTFDYEQNYWNAPSISYLLIGRGYEAGYPFKGSIDLPNSIIKVDDTVWFNGQPAMTKTLSCVGCTGTADLTAEDKDIALNKNWQLTLS